MIQIGEDKKLIYPFIALFFFIVSIILLYRYFKLKKLLHEYSKKFDQDILKENILSNLSFLIRNITFEISEEKFLKFIFNIILGIIPFSRGGSLIKCADEHIIVLYAQGHNFDKLLKMKIHSKMINEINKNSYPKFEVDFYKKIFLNRYNAKIFEFNKYSKSLIINISGNFKYLLIIDFYRNFKEIEYKKILEIAYIIQEFLNNILYIHQQLEFQKNMTKNVVFSFLKALEFFDPYTKGHSERVAKYALEIGKYLDLDENKLNNLYWASILHDIGKIGIEKDILLKTTSLTYEEFEIIKSHPVKGAEILMEFEDMKEIAKIVRHHHERWDGKGYPDGLAYDKIPIESRIIAVADSFDAMISNRPYRKSLSVFEAIEEIKKNSGKQFDPEIVDVFLRVISLKDFFMIV